MSGGHFNYQQDRCFEIADMIDAIIQKNDSTELDEYGDPISYGFSPETIERFKEAAHCLRQAGEMAQRVDWLVSCDDGEESFHERWTKEVRGYWHKARKNRRQK